MSTVSVYVKSADRSINENFFPRIQEFKGQEKRMAYKNTIDTKLGNRFMVKKRKVNQAAYAISVNEVANTKGN